MAFAVIEDFTGTAECILFSEVYTAARELLGSDRPVLVKGTISTKGEDDLKLIVSRILPLDQAARLLEVRIGRSRLEAEPELLQDLKRLFVQNSGTTPVRICITDGGGESCLRSRSLQVAATSRLLDGLAARIGREGIRLWSQLEAGSPAGEPGSGSVERPNGQGYRASGTYDRQARVSAERGRALRTPRPLPEDAVESLTPAAIPVGDDEI